MAKTVEQLEVRGRKALIRVDFNVPQDDAGNITDDRRIRAALPTIRSVLERGGRAVLMSHLGRPKGKVNAKYSLAPAAERLGELIGQPVPLAPDCVGPQVQKMVDALSDGQAVVLENLRFHAEEEEGGAEFARQIAALGELYINDAFGTAHRDHASMVGVPERLGPDRCAAGFLLRKEVEYLKEKLADPPQPFVMIMGGAKVSDKIGVIENLLPRISTLLVGGAMSYTFMKANGRGIGDSRVEADKLDLARQIQSQAASAGVALELPVDFVCGKEFKAGTETRTVEDEIPDGWQGFDIGPRTRKKYAAVLSGARTIVWNGPAGVFEIPPFDAGTRALAEAVAAATDAGALSIIGGGDSALAVEQAGLADRMSHISTGGGASLELLEGRHFRSLEVLGWPV